MSCNPAFCSGPSSQQWNAGHYSHATGAKTEAARHFTAGVATAADSHTRNIAAVNAAIEHLESSAPGSVAEAMEALKQQGLFAGSPLDGLPFHEQCVPGPEP